jgi:outer membrane protein assembly factor BamB
MAEKVAKPSRPHLAAASYEVGVPAGLRLATVRNPRAKSTLGDLGAATRVSGPAEFTQVLLVQPFDSRGLVGIDGTSVRMFRNDGRTLRPVWASGVNVALGFTWARIDRPGVYVALGLPRDRLLQALLGELALRRRYAQPRSADEEEALTRAVLAPLLELPIDELEALRAALTRVEVQTGAAVSFRDLRMGRGGHMAPFALPGDATIEELRERIVSLRTPGGGLPEEVLFDPPERLLDYELPWPTFPGLASPYRWIDREAIDRLTPLLADRFHALFPFFWSKNWWMYQHDVRHSGHASGWSGLTSTSVGSLVLQSAVNVDSAVITKPAIVNGKVYIGSVREGGAGGTLYKIDLATGTKEGEFHTDPRPAHYGIAGIGGSPAVVGHRVYFTSVNGFVHCIDTTSMALGGPPPPPLWVTDLKQADPAHKQPVHQPQADSWTGPLVVNGRVYIGCGEGEDPNTYGFVFCLDANTGNVIWLFCTAKFQDRHAPGSENAPNVIPASVAISDPLPAWATAAGFSIHPDPLADRSTGCSVWSSPAYDAVHDRIYVGTGNSQYGPGWTDTTAPDKWYGSGCIALDATTGEFRGFHQSQTDDSYWPGDSDIDVPGSPTVFSIGATRAVAYGCKNGSLFVLDAGTMAPMARRQLLARIGGTGLPGDRGTGIPSVVPTPAATGGEGENAYGVMGTPAVHFGLGRIFVGIGGYNGMALDQGPGIDQTRTPFLRALNWNDLHDAWPTALGADNVLRYTTTKPPMYLTTEVGLSSPAVVNDVVFVSTDKPALYALDANSGICLWSAPGLPASRNYVLGPAVYGNYVVVGAGSTVYIYTLASRLRFPWRRYELVVPWWERFPWPPPPPPDLSPVEVIHGEREIGS